MGFNSKIWGYLPKLTKEEIHKIHCLNFKDEIVKEKIKLRKIKQNGKSELSG